MDFEAFVGCHVDVAIAVVTRDLSVELCFVSLPSHLDNLTTNTKPPQFLVVSCAPLSGPTSLTDTQSTASQPPVNRQKPATRPVNTQ